MSDSFLDKLFSKDALKGPTTFYESTKPGTAFGIAPVIEPGALKQEKLEQKRRQAAAVKASGQFFSDYEASEKQIREEAKPSFSRQMLVDAFADELGTPKTDITKTSIPAVASALMPGSVPLTSPEDVSFGIDTPTAFDSIEMGYRKKLRKAAPGPKETRLSAESAPTGIRDEYGRQLRGLDLATVTPASSSELADPGRGFLVPGEVRVESPSKMMDGYVLRGEQLLTPAEMLELRKTKEFFERINKFRKDSPKYDKKGKPIPGTKVDLPLLQPGSLFINPGTYTTDNPLIEAEIERVAKERRKGKVSELQKARSRQFIEGSGGSALMMPGFSFIKELGDFFVPDVDENIVTAEQVEDIQRRGGNLGLANLGPLEKINLGANPFVAAATFGENIRRILMEDRDSQGKLDLLDDIYGFPAVGNLAISMVRPDDETGESGVEVLAKGLAKYARNPGSFIEDMKFYQMGDRGPDDYGRKMMRNLPMSGFFAVADKIVIPLLMADAAMTPGPASKKIRKAGEVARGMAQFFAGTLNVGEYRKMLAEDPVGVGLTTSALMKGLASRSGAKSRADAARAAYEEALPEVTEAGARLGDVTAQMRQEALLKNKLVSRLQEIREVKLPDSRREAQKYQDMIDTRREVVRLEREIPRLERTYRRSKKIVDTAPDVRKRLKDELAAGKRASDLSAGLKVMSSAFSKFKKAANRLEQLKTQARRIDVRAQAKQSQQLFGRLEKLRAEIAALELALDVDAPKRLQDLRRVRGSKAINEARAKLRSSLERYESLIRRYNRATSEYRSKEGTKLQREMKEAFEELDDAYQSLSELGREMDFGQEFIGAIGPMLDKTKATLDAAPELTASRSATADPRDVSKGLMQSAKERSAEMRGGLSPQRVMESSIQAVQSRRSARERLPEARKELRVVSEQLKAADDLYYSGKKGVDVFEPRREDFDAKVTEARRLMDEAKKELQESVPKIYEASGVAMARDSVIIKRALNTAEEIINNIDAPFLTDQFSSAVRAIEGPVMDAMRTGRRARDDFKRDFRSTERVAKRISRHRKTLSDAQKAVADAEKKLFSSPEGKGLKDRLKESKQRLMRMSALKPGTDISTMTPDQLQKAFADRFQENLKPLAAGRRRFVEQQKTALSLEKQIREQQKKLSKTQLLYSEVKQQVEPILEKDRLLREQLKKAEGGFGLPKLTEPVSELAETLLIDIIPMALTGTINPIAVSPLNVFDMTMDVVRLTDRIAPRFLRERAAAQLAKDPAAAKKNLDRADRIRFYLRAPENRLAQAYIDMQYQAALVRDQKVFHLQQAIQELGPEVAPTANMWLHMEHSVSDAVRLPDSKKPIFSIDEDQSLVGYERLKTRKGGVDGVTGRYYITDRGKEVASQSKRDAIALQQQVDLHNAHMKPLTDKLTEISIEAADLGLLYDPSTGRPLWFPQEYSKGFKFEKTGPIRERIRRLQTLQDELFDKAVEMYPELQGAGQALDIVDPQAAKALQAAGEAPQEAVLRMPDSDNVVRSTPSARDRTRVRANIVRRAAKKWEQAETARINAETAKLISQGTKPEKAVVARKENPFSIEQREAVGLVTDVAKSVGAGVNGMLETVQQHQLYRKVARTQDKSVTITKREYDGLPAERKAQYQVPESGYMEGSAADKAAGKIPTSLGEINGILKRVVDPETGRTVNQWSQRTGDDVLYVNRDILKEMEMTQRFQRQLRDSLGSNWLRRWKITKTVLSPTTTLRNLYTNMLVFAPKDGVSPFNPANFKYYKQIISDLMKPVGQRSKEYKLAFETGVFRGNQARVELAADVDSMLPGAGGINNTRQLIDALIEAPYKAPKMGVENAGRLYSAIDDIFRGASAYKKYDKIRKSGQDVIDPASAQRIAKESRKNYVDYEQVNGLVQVMRAPVGNKAIFYMAGKPFIAFTAGAVPMMRSFLAESPIRGAMYNNIMTQVTQDNLVDAGYDPATEDFIAAMLPDYEKAFGVNLQSILPFDLDTPERDTAFGDGVTRYFLNTSWINPFSFLMPQQTANFFQDNKALNYVGQILLGESPILGSLVDVMNNYDHFRGRPIYSEDDTSANQTRRILQYLIDGLLPSWTPGLASDDVPGQAKVTGGALARRLTDAEEGRLTKRGLPVSDFQAGAYGLGLNVSESDLSFASDQFFDLVSTRKGAFEKIYAGNEQDRLNDIKASPDATSRMNTFVMSRLRPGLERSMNLIERMGNTTPLLDVYMAFAPAIIDATTPDEQGNIQNADEGIVLYDRMIEVMRGLDKTSSLVNQMNRNEQREAVKNASKLFTN